MNSNLDNKATSVIDIWFCPICEHEIQEPTNLCDNCGYIRKHCLECKTPIYVKTNFCAKCGSPLTDNNQNTPKQQTKTDTSTYNMNTQKQNEYPEVKKHTDNSSANDKIADQVSYLTEEQQDKILMAYRIDTSMTPIIFSLSCLICLLFKDQLAVAVKFWGTESIFAMFGIVSIILLTLGFIIFKIIVAITVPYYSVRKARYIIKMRE